MFTILYHPDVLKEDLPGINKNLRLLIKAAIENRLIVSPQDYGKPLRGELHSLWSLRVSDYRIIYQIKGNTVTILQVVNRRDAYEAGILEARRHGFI